MNFAFLEYFFSGFLIPEFSAADDFACHFLLGALIDHQVAFGKSSTAQ